MSLASLVEQIEELLRQAERYAGAVSGSSKRFYLFESATHNDVEAAEYALNAISRAVAAERATLQPHADEQLQADTLRAARALAKAELDSGDGGHDAAMLQEMLAFVLECHDALNLVVAARPLGDERRRAAIQRVIDHTDYGVDIGDADVLTDEICAALGLPPRRPVVGTVEMTFHDVSPEVMSIITGGIPLTDEDRIEAAARSIANLEPGEEWPSNDDLGGHPMLGTRDDEYRDNIRETARAALKAAGVIA